MTKLDEFLTAKTYAEATHDNILAAIDVHAKAMDAMTEARYLAVLEVACPLRHCLAEPGEPCSFGGRPSRLRSTHGVRDDLAGCEGPGPRDEIISKIREGGSRFRYRPPEEVLPQ